MTQADSVHSTPPLNTSSISPTAGLDWLDVKADASPQEIFRAIGQLRKEAKDEIDRLIRFLDETENHMELEPCDDEGEGEDAEPSLGSFDRMIDQSKSWQKCERDTDIYGSAVRRGLEQSDADNEEAR